MTNEQLVARIKAGENVGENMAQLYEQVRSFIHTVAWKYRGMGELEDLEQEGFLSLYDAVDGYDAAQGVKFLTYAEYWIRQRIRRYLQENGSVRLPVYCMDRLQQYKRLCSSFQLEYGREPSEREIACLMGLTLEQIREIKKNACMARVGSLDAPVKGLDGGEDTTVGDMTASGADQEEEVLDHLQQEQLCTVLWECVDSLPGRQPDVIRKRFQSGMTLDAIGQEYGMTRDAIRQDQMKALRELRKPSRAKRLCPFLPEADRVYSMALVGNGVGRFNRTWTSSTERAALKLNEHKERQRIEIRTPGKVAISQQII